MLTESATKTPKVGRTLTRSERLVRRVVRAWDDPVCCCEPEPRWLRFQQEREHPRTPGEWESLERAPCEEL